MADIPKLLYARDWTVPADFPTYVEDEETVRRDMQYHPDAVKDYINDILIPGVEKQVDDLRPKLDTPATAADVLLGKEAVVNDGEVIVGEHVCPSVSDLTQEATASAADILTGKKAYVKGELVTGTLVTEGGVILPELSTPAAAADIAVGKEAVDGAGSIVTGTLPETKPGESVYLDGYNTLIYDGKMFTGPDSLASDILLRAGSSVVVRSDATELGDAAAEDVAAGKRFTSASGLHLEGTHICPTVTDLLPELTDPAGAEDVVEGKEFVDASGNRAVGTHVCVVTPPSEPVLLGTVSLSKGLSASLELPMPLYTYHALVFKANGLASTIVEDYTTASVRVTLAGETFSVCSELVGDPDKVVTDDPFSGSLRFSTFDVDPDDMVVYCSTWNGNMGGFQSTNTEYYSALDLNTKTLSVLVSDDSSLGSISGTLKVYGL